jgi:CRP-like cAMP-binding protein
MSAAPVDTRELKDSAAEHLKSSRFDKAAEVLEKLVKAEPADVQHRLRLGDSYRRLKETEKAVEQYERAGRHFADEGQLIKAIAAFKVILEMDPRNATAREQLSAMNRQRRSRPAPASSAPSRAKAPDVPFAKQIEPIELPAEDAPTSRKIKTGEIPDYGKELVFDERAEKFSTGKRTKDVLVPPPPAVVDAGPAQDEPVRVERLPTDAIVGTAVEDPASRPIADLLGSDVEEEIELLSHLEDAPSRQALEEGGITEEIEAAVGAIAPLAQTRRRLPTRVPLFDDLPHEALVELVNRLSHLRYRAGDQILKEGERGRSFFVIVEGKVRIWKTLSDGSEMELAVLEEGAFFGEMAPLSGAPRTANASAEVDTELLELTDSVLRDLTRKYPHVAQSLKNFYRRRLLENVMSISPLFRDFDPSERPHIVEKFRLRQAAPGEMLIKQGTPSDGLYVVLHGSVDVTAKDVPLARLREGDIFGEMSLLKREPANATVTSSGNSILLRLAKENFQELVVTHPQILALVSELTEQRASETRAALERHSISSFV